MDGRDSTVLHDPPHASELPERLDALCAFANAPTATAREPFLHPVLRAIAIHFQLGYDHPFVDGNGRATRALFYGSMLRAGYWLTGFLSISSVLKQAPAQYSRAYRLTESDPTDLSFFAAHHLAVLSKAVDGLHAYIARKANERRKAEALLPPGSRWGGRLNHRQRELQMHAVRNPGAVFRIAEHRRSTQVTYQTARSDLLGLQQAGLFDLHEQGRSFAFTPKKDLASILGV